MLLNVMGHLHSSQSLGLGQIKESLGLAVQPMAHLLQHDIGIGILAWMLSNSRDAGKDFIHIGQIEVATERQVLGTPVVTAQEGVNILQSTLARSGVAQVTHIDLARKGQAALGVVGVMQLLLRQILELTLHRAEDFGDSPRPHGPFAKHILFARVGLELHTGQSCSLLPTVMLFLHEQIEFIQAIHPGAILLLIVLQRFEQANHCHATFML